MASTPHHVDVSSDELPKLLRENRLVIVHYWAEWNLIDKKMQHTLDTLLREGWSEIGTVARLNIDENIDFCRGQPFENVPYLQFYRDGSLVRGNMGLCLINDLRKQLNEFVYGPDFQD